MHIRATLDREVLMPAVRAYMLFATLGDFGEIVGGIPPSTASSSSPAREIEVWLASENEDESIAAAARTVSDIVDVVVAEEPADRRPPGRAGRGRRAGGRRSPPRRRRHRPTTNTLRPRSQARTRPAPRPPARRCRNRRGCAPFVSTPSGSTR